MLLIAFVKLEDFLLVKKCFPVVFNAALDYTIV